MTVELSVLVCSVKSRYRTFGLAIQDQLWQQHEALSSTDQQRVEILLLTDAKSMMLGHKRNVMVDMAQGRYVVFVDDDDRIEPDYLVSLLDAVRFDADVITFLVSVSLNGGKPKLCRYSIDFPADRNLIDRYERLPNHICAVKREKAVQVSFPNVAYGEDAGYSKLLKPLLQNEHHIPRVLYAYVYNVATTEAQAHRRAPMRRRSRSPMVDVIIMSNTETAELQAMTQQAIDTCVAGANSLAVNVIVMEQQHGHIYGQATSVQAPAEFNYNRFANIGANMGTAPWIMVANNDLVFQDGWLHALLAADYPVVSPKCPNDPRQRRHTENIAGYRVGEYLSGWCFMLKRSLWKQIGGFDEDFPFWCADDATMEQVKAAGIAPMLVPASQVVHLGSVTLNRSADADNLCWGGVEAFEAKYGPHRLAQHPKYLKWQQRKAEVS